MQWICFSDHAEDILGLLPEIFRADDDRPAVEQANDRYAHGGGWFPQTGWTIEPGTGIAHYDGDPPFQPLCVAKLHDEMIIVYPHAYVAILQEDGSYQMARMD